MDFVEINAKPDSESPEDFQTTADTIGTDLALRMADAKTMLHTRLPNVIAADYQKLKTVGSCTSDLADDQADCPPGYDPTGWRFSPDDKAAAEKALRDQLQVTLYSALLPAQYKLYRLPLWWRTKVNGYTGAVGGEGNKSDFYGTTGFGVCSGCYPFDREADTGQYAKPIFRLIPTYAHSVFRKENSDFYESRGDTWEIFALGSREDGQGSREDGGTINNPWVMHVPAARATDPLFKPAPEGLGVYPETFFDRAFTPATLDHFPWQDSKTGWCVHYYNNIDYEKACNGG
jgi:hypothetical protein